MLKTVRKDLGGSVALNLLPVNGVSETVSLLGQTLADVHSLTFSIFLRRKKNKITHTHTHTQEEE